MLPVLLCLGGRWQVAVTFSEFRRMIPVSPLQLHVFGFALPVTACGGTALCQGRAVPGVGHMGHRCRDAALAPCPAVPQAASYHISASCRLADVQAHKLSLKQWGTRGRGEPGNSNDNKRLLNLKAFFSWICSVFLCQHVQSDRVTHSVDVQELFPARTQKRPWKSCSLNFMRLFFLSAMLRQTWNQIHRL